MRFSPDGSSLLLQDDAGIFVLSHKLLKVLLYSDMGKAYPAEFSADSQGVSTLTYDLVLTTWRLSDLKNPQRRELSVQHGCLDAQLSPDAAWIACFTSECFLDLYRASDLQRVFSQRITPAISSGVFLPNSGPNRSPLSAPFGFAISDFSALANRGTFRSAIKFAPGSGFLLVNEEASSFRLDLPSLRKTNLPGPIRKVNRGILGFPSEDRVLVSESKKDSEHRILSLTSGDTLASPAFTADTAHIATNPRFALLANFDAPGAVVFDLEKNASLSTPPNLGIDIFGNELALINSDGELRLYHLGDEQATIAGRLPLGPLPPLRSALMDPSPAVLALSANGGGAAYDLATGKRLSTFKSIRGVTSLSPTSAYVAVPLRGEAFPGISRWTSQGPREQTPLWTADKTADFVSSREVFVAYSLYHQMGMYFPIGFKGQLPFELRGLDPSTGRELWHHRYAVDPPVPFSDPQGSRIVLGWRAHTAEAQSAAKPFPSAREALKKQKLKDQDSFLEVLDATSGVSLGGVLVQFGSGPASFESAFSVGDFLFLTKDEYRLTVFRLQEGTNFGRFRGRLPAVNDRAKIFALDDGVGKISLYSLENGAKVAERHINDYVSYLSFSEKGDRLLVLTAHQMAYILDVKKTIEMFPATASKPAVSEPEPENP